MFVVIWTSSWKLEVNKTELKIHKLFHRTQSVSVFDIKNVRIGEKQEVTLYDMDDKIIAIPYGDPTYNCYTDIEQLPSHIFDEIRNFFNIYKSLEGNKTKVDEFGGPIDAAKIICKCIDLYNEEFEGESHDNK